MAHSNMENLENVGNLKIYRKSQGICEFSKKVWEKKERNPLNGNGKKKSQNLTNDSKKKIREIRKANLEK